jgi:hypothetical protein
VDLDFATRSKDRGAFYELLEAEGYTPDKRHNALFGGKQAYFVDVARKRPVDVLVDSLEMCHRMEFSDRLALSKPTLPLGRAALSKLQVVKINKKDVLDALVLLAEHPLARTTARSTRATGSGPSTCRGSCRSPRTTGAGGGRDRQPRHARALPRDRGHGGGPRPPQRRASCSTEGADRRPAKAVDDAPKSTRWKLRARVGERTQWYNEPEEMGHN